MGVAPSKSANVPCTTTSSYALTTTTAAFTKLPLQTSTSAFATTTSSKPVATSASPAKFYLKSSCDNSCIGHFAADGQIYSNLYSSTDSTFDSFYISNGVLYDGSLSTSCVSSEAGGTETRFQCSNDPDYIDGVAVPNVWSSTPDLLTLNGNSVWYGCGTLNLAESYEPDGLTYSVAQGDPSNCRACSFKLVTDIAQCNAGGQAPAATITTDHLPAATPVSTTTSPAAQTTTKSVPATTTATTTTALSPVTTPKACGSGYTKVSWLSQPDCYVADCHFCPWGTYCQQYQTWPWPLLACLPPKSFWK